MRVPPGHNRQLGLTLIELMIALLIGSILLTGLISLFLTTRQTQQTREHVNRVAEDARFFTEFVGHDIRMAGYQNDSCSFSAPGLAWDNSTKTLTIRYCRPGQSQNDLITYQFEQGSNGLDSVSYSDDDTPADGTSPTPQPLLDGLNLEHIWFGEESSGGLTYNEDTNPDFSHLRTVRLAFQLRGDIPSSATPSESEMTPAFQFTVAVRNNTLQPLSTPNNTN